MALPVLLTVAGLGTGFLLLSRKRAKIADAAKPEAGAQPAGADSGVYVSLVASAGDAAGAGAEGGNPQVSVGTGEGVIIDPIRTDGADPSTSAVAGTLPASQASDGQPQADAISSARVLNDSVYGNTNGVTNKQMSKTLSEVGPAMGLVW